MEGCFSNCSGDTPRCKGYAEDRSEICEKPGASDKTDGRDSDARASVGPSPPHMMSIVGSTLQNGRPRRFLNFDDQKAAGPPLQ